jgi:uncharacterized protein
MIAYNSFSNAMALMEKEKYNVFMDFCENGKTIEDEEFAKQLQAGHFLIEDDCDELVHLRFRLLRSRYASDYLALTIAPTADCNFRCPYCYEKDIIKPHYMTVEVEDAIIKFVESRAKAITYLSVSWYGGEPLMNTESIKRISESIIGVCEENDIIYNSSIITNGYFLTAENAQLLNEVKVTSIQVTLDGAKEKHDKRRPLVDGSGSFDVILSNLQANKDILPNISLRINVDKDNIDEAMKVNEALNERGLQDLVSTYLGKVTKDNDDYSSSACFNSREFAKENFEFYVANLADKNFFGQYPRKLGNVCTADCLHSHVIGSNGDIYRCWVDIGNEKRKVGNLLDATDPINNVFLDYMMFDPTVALGCSDCKLLPVCMGGCPLRRVNGAGESNEKCAAYKFIFSDYLEIIATMLKKQKHKELAQ